MSHVINDNSQVYRVKNKELIFFKLTTDEEQIYQTETLKQGALLLLVQKDVLVKVINEENGLDWPDGFLFHVFYDFATKTSLGIWHPAKDETFFDEKFELADSL